VCDSLNKLVQTLKVYENRVLRKVFEPKRVEVPAGWRKL
jgi:hypothetical protein